MKNVFSKIKDDFDKLKTVLDIPIFYLNKKANVYPSVRYTYFIKNKSSYDDSVDVLEVKFLLNVYVKNDILNINDKVFKALNESDFYGINFIDTVEEEKGCFNSAFTCQKIYNIKE